MSRWRGENKAMEESERLKADRERYRREALYRPEAVQVIALNHRERDAARDAYQTLEAVAMGEYEKRTGKHPIKDQQWGGLNSGWVVDEIIHAINLSRVRQAEENNVNLRDGRGVFGD